ncbi:hypothetical protein V6N11_021307 [Hibiscus sabdariffa]|uniref:Uncharacterized protein n=1 Tax=Hibiscus sabdariffa TaxID=183260 RepID=A0ABR2NMD1_9ROSI
MVLCMAAPHVHPGSPPEPRSSFLPTCAHACPIAADKKKQLGNVQLARTCRKEAASGFRWRPEIIRTSGAVGRDYGCAANKVMPSESNPQGPGAWW